MNGTRHLRGLASTSQKTRRTRAACCLASETWRRGRKEVTDVVEGTPIEDEVSEEDLRALVDESGDKEKLYEMAEGASRARSSGA